MSSKSLFHRVFLVLALLALATLPAQARPARRPIPAVAVPGDTVLSGIWRFMLSLWPGGVAKEGTSIDPNGGNNHAGTSTPAPGDLTNEGTSIDPDGSR
jgi:hypothetical protein